MMRFLIKPLDEEYYTECVKIFEQLPQSAQLRTDSEGDWISLFALGINGYTQRYSDVGDIQGGLAGLFTLGRYKGEAVPQTSAQRQIKLTGPMLGANLCLPQLGSKVPYAPGACAIIPGDLLEHLVEDHSGPRFFVIGTNHETCRKHALRKLGRLPPLPDPQPRTLKRKLAEYREQGPDAAE